jgi:hypothetical protein
MALSKADMCPPVPHQCTCVMPVSKEETSARMPHQKEKSGRNMGSKLEWTTQLSNEEDFQSSFNLGKGV